MEGGVEEGMQAEGANRCHSYLCTVELLSYLQPVRVGYYATFRSMNETGLSC